MPLNPIHLRRWIKVLVRIIAVQIKPCVIPAEACLSADRRESRRAEFIDPRWSLPPLVSRFSARGGSAFGGRGNNKNGGGDDKIHVLHTHLRRYNRFNLDTYAAN